MNRTKLIYTLILSFLFCTFLSAAAFAAEGLIYFSDPSVEAGNNVEVQMTVHCDTEKVGEVNVLLKYPTEELVFLDGTSASGGAGTIRIHGAGSNTENGKYVYSLNFATKEKGEYAVTIDSEEVYSESGTEITITHQGSSTITVTSSTSLNKDVLLESLEISPGSLVPAFEPSIANYSITVGLSVERLTISANPADTGCMVSVENNEMLKEGENDVIIYVRSEDGSSQSEYHISVLKAEGGEENIASETESTEGVDISTGVQLACKSKSIKIMEPKEHTEIPEGFRESTIKIDGQPVTGWIKEDSDDPEYFLVYGMNDEGDINFYRYDRREKTIQRFFEETKEHDITQEEEYIALNSLYEESQTKLNSGKMYLYIAGIVALLMIGIVIYLAVRLASVNRELEQIRERADRRTRERSLDPEKSKRSRRTARTEDASDATVVIRHSAREMFEEDDREPVEEKPDTEPVSGQKAEEETSSPDVSANGDETKVLGTRESRRVSRRAAGLSDETTVIRRESRRHREDI